MPGRYGAVFVGELSDRLDRGPLSYVLEGNRGAGPIPGYAHLAAEHVLLDLGKSGGQLERGGNAEIQEIAFVGHENFVVLFQRVRSVPLQEVDSGQVGKCRALANL